MESCKNTYADQAVLGLELLLGLLVVVDETEALRRATTELGAETEDDDALLLGLVELGEALSEVVARDVGTGGVGDSDNELLAVKQAVGDELRSPDGDGSGGVLRCQLAIRRVEQREISLLHDAAQKLDPGLDNFGNLQRTAQTARRSKTLGLLYSSFPDAR